MTRHDGGIRTTTDLKHTTLTNDNVIRTAQHNVHKASARIRQVVSGLEPGFEQISGGEIRISRLCCAGSIEFTLRDGLYCTRGIGVGFTTEI